MPPGFQTAKALGPCRSYFGRAAYYRCRRRPRSSLVPEISDSSFSLATTRGICANRVDGARIAPWPVKRRFVSTSTAGDTDLGKRREDLYALIDKLHQHEDELAEILDELYLLPEYEHVLDIENWNLVDTFSGVVGHRNYEALENKVRNVRQVFGETVPEGYLNEAEVKVYERLYGDIVIKPAEPERTEQEKEAEPNVLLRDDGQGGYEEVEYHISREEPDGEGDRPGYVRSENEVDYQERAEEIAKLVGGEVISESELKKQMEEEEEEARQRRSRFHSLTLAGRFSTSPSTIQIPSETFNLPISAILSQFSKRHLKSVAHKVFGGEQLPHSTRTLPPRAQVPQLPIPLSASQHFMGEMESNAFLAVLYPGIYASVTSILVEVRKRLGTSWIRNLLSKEGGPRILDVGGAGASVLAWRDIIRAECEATGYPEHSPLPFGKSTVLAGAENLQERASVLLENTTFLPRLPDYVHVRNSPTVDDDREPPKRKQFDIIIAAHSLLEIEEDYLRKHHVKNLWNMLDPNGGVLILLEKGRQRGFEAIAGARELILERLIASPGSTEYQDLLDTSNESTVKKEKGMIIAPCTNHGRCPMYPFPGQSKGRSDYCHFEQRYIRPQYLQRIIGAKDRNHEDVAFSYIAVQRGVDLRQTENIVQGKEATDAAFKGFEYLNEWPESESKPESSESSDNSQTPFHPLALPRTLYPPLKRRGHVILDLCTPEAKIERWIVPRSFSRQAYHDARKAQWGDLWALGAKTRVPRNLRLGHPKEGLSKKERLEQRAASRRNREEHGDELSRMMEDEDEEKSDMMKPFVVAALNEQSESLERRKEGKTIPSWKKKATKKKIRQAFKKLAEGNAS